MSQFDSIKCESDIRQLIEESSSPDGETASFELKGTYERLSPNKEDKKRFAKEICALANSYGGVLCIHKGGDKDVKPFKAAEAEKLFSHLESWSRDSLEPRCSIRVKVVSNYVLVGINESITKPHRSAADMHYYYRHETQSEKMPEIMIGALYRSQAMLQTKSVVWLDKMNDRSELMIFADVTNRSRVAGTNPKIQIQLYSSFVGSFDYTGEYSVRESLESGYVKNPLLSQDWIRWNGWVTTDREYQQLILYPEDSLTLKVIAKPNAASKHKLLPRLIIARIDVMFAESPRFASYTLMDFGCDGTGPQRGKTVCSVDENDFGSLVAKYVALNGE